MRNISKEIFLNALTCPTLGWLTRAEEVSETLSLAERFRMEQGIEIGKRARQLYPEGVLIDDRNIISASTRTKNLMDDPNTSLLFEGAFFIDGFTAKADILKRKGKSWHMIEVKSSLNDKDEFIDDMAYTAMITGCLKSPYPLKA